MENNEYRYMADLMNFIWRFNLDTVSGSLKRGIRNMKVRYSEGLLYIPRTRNVKTVVRKCG
jgi:hypothetical protein